MIIHNFITEQERLTLLDWAFLNENRLNANGFGRKYNQLGLLVPSNLVMEVRSRVDALHDNWVRDTVFTDFLSFNTEGAAIHPHIDPIIKDCHIHRRFNLVLQKPDQGGDSIQNGAWIPVENGMLFQIDASHVTHCSQKVVGPNPRITISFGYQIK